jgi:hypothetical protein
LGDGNVNRPGVRTLFSPSRQTKRDLHWITGSFAMRIGSPNRGASQGASRTSSSAGLTFDRRTCRGLEGAATACGQNVYMNRDERLRQNRGRLARRENMVAAKKHLSQSDSGRPLRWERKLDHFSPQLGRNPLFALRNSCRNVKLNYFCHGSLLKISPSRHLRSLLTSYHSHPH